MGGCLWDGGGRVVAQPSVAVHDADVMRVAAAVAVLMSALACVASSAQAAGDRSSSGPRLTRDVPRFVKQVCASGRSSSPIRLVCPPLVPVTKYRKQTGLSGVLLGSTNIPRLKPPADRIYLLGFNGGDSGPTYWHWVAGIGTREAIQYWVLSDARNEVRGKPKQITTLVVEERKVEIWRFPMHPAGGGLGGHVAAITRSGPYFAIASVHGYDTVNASARVAVALARKADALR